MPLPPPDSREVFGAEIQYFRLEPRYWAPMLDRFAETGLQCVTSYVPWGEHGVEPPTKGHPAGVLDFEGRTDPRLNLLRFLELITERGLRLNFRGGPFCCNEMVYGGYPAWIAMADPGMMVWDCTNRPQQGYWNAKPEGMQPSYLHPDYLEQTYAWLDALTPIIKAHLHQSGGCVSMINLDNEVSYIVQDAFLKSDYNPINVGPGGFYHQFLQEKYGDEMPPYPGQPEDLKAIQPPRHIPETVSDDLAWYMDWAEFKQWVMARYLVALRERYEHHGIGPDAGVRFMTNLNPHRPEGVPTRMPVFEQAVGGEAGGIVGYDFYRSAYMSYSGYHSLARVLKLMNASMRYTWSAEFMSGIWNLDFTHASRVPDDHMRFMARCALAHGCKSIAWFMFHDRDCWGDSPASSHAHPRPSLDVLRETPRLLFEKLDDWDALQPQGDAGVVYDLASHRHTHLGDPMPCNDNAVHVGTPAIAGVDAGKASVEYEGLFRLIEQAGYQPLAFDPVHDSNPTPGLRIMFFPGSPVVSRATAAALKRWVETGGTLIVSGCWPTLDERGERVKFLGRGGPGGFGLGHGDVVWWPAYLGQANPEQDPLETIDTVRGWIDRAVGDHFAVRIRPEQDVRYVDWIRGGGAAEHYHQPRNLGSAVLHVSPDGGAALFVMNHYVDAVRFDVEFGAAHRGFSTAVNLDTDAPTPIVNGRCVLDIDRKSAPCFRLD